MPDIREHMMHFDAFCIDIMELKTRFYSAIFWLTAV